MRNGGLEVFSFSIITASLSDSGREMWWKIRSIQGLRSYRLWPWQLAVHWLGTVKSLPAVFMFVFMMLCKYGYFVYFGYSKVQVCLLAYGQGADEYQYYSQLQYFWIIFGMWKNVDKKVLEDIKEIQKLTEYKFVWPGGRCVFISFSMKITWKIFWEINSWQSTS